MKHDRYLPAYISAGLLLFIIVAGTSGYILIEGWTFTESFFMTIITMATVGFGEVKPLSQTGIYFTSFLIVISFGIFAYAITTFTRFIVDGVSVNYFKSRRVNKKIDKMKNHVIICGFGRNGKQAAYELQDHNIPFVIIEREKDIVDQLIEDYGFLAIQGDAIHDEVLLKAGIKEANALIATLPADADNLFVVISAKQLNEKINIITRASDDNSDSKLKSAGAKSVIMPDKVGGRRMAKLVAQPDVVEFIEFIMMQGGSDVKLEEIICENIASTYDGKSIKDLDIRNESGANIIGLKRGDQSFVINPPPDTVLSVKDKMFILGTVEQIEKFKKIMLGNDNAACS